MPDVLVKGDKSVKDINRIDLGVSSNLVNDFTGVLDPEQYAIASALLRMHRKRQLAYLEHDLEPVDQEEKETNT